MNGKLTPGGGVNLTGTRLRIIGDHPSVGLKLVNMETGVETTIPIGAIPVNNPSRITFVVPPDLPQGNYRLVLATQFVKPKKTLKEPRTYEFEYPLTV